MSEYAFIGIDPGLSGGIAVISPSVTILVPMPIAGKEIDVDKVVYFLYDPIENYPRVAFVEKVGAMPGQGVVSMFNFGFSTGIIHGILRTLYIPVELVAPQTWKKKVLVNTDRSKEAAIDWCRRMYPKVSLMASFKSTKYHSGMADALCLAHYGKITWK